MSDRVEETQLAINAVFMDYETKRNPVMAEIALSLAAIADALTWQVEQEIHDRANAWQGMPSKETP